MRTPLIACLVAILIAPSHAGAQDAASEEAAAWQAFAASLEPGTFVAVRLTDGSRVKGTVVQHSSTGVLVKPKTRIPVPARELEYRYIDSIERQKQGMSPGAKVVLGTGIGIAIVMLTAAIALSGID